MSNSLTQIRKNGIKALETILKNPNNIKIIEKTVCQVCKNNNEEYEKIMYQVCGDILSDIPLKKIMSNLNSESIGWSNPIFSDIKRRLDEHDEFIVNPFEVAEGVTQCSKCGSKKTYTYPMQCRSSDEPTSTIAQCMNCKEKWTYSG